MTTAIVPTARADLANVQGQVPALYAHDEPTAKRTFEFFAVSIRNPNTRKAYARAAAEFASWCEGHGIADVRQVQPVHVAAYIEGLQIAAPSVKVSPALSSTLTWLIPGSGISAGSSAVAMLTPALLRMLRQV